MQGYPVASKGQVVGLLGGSFDPAHAGHVAITKAALTRFGLDRVWWLVSPSNPLKTRAPATLEQRLTRACDVMRHPHVKITGIEAQLGTRYTAQTIPALKHRYPGVRFVWLMGSDNLAQFHRWQDWRHIMHNVPVGVMARPGVRTAARTARASRIFKPYQLQGRESQLLGRCEAPAWCLINLPMSPESSTRIRAAQDWT